MTVVIIIAVSAALAIPTATRQFQERRSLRLTQELVAAYRNGRTAAMARGSAVVVRYDNGTVSVLEGLQGGTDPNSGCAYLPVAQCNRSVMTGWDNGATGNRVLVTLDPASYAGTGITPRVIAHDGGTPAQLDVCFTPLGRAFIRQGTAAAFGPMTQVVTLDVERWNGTEFVGLRRTVTVPPNGAARLGTAR